MDAVLMSKKRRGTALLIGAALAACSSDAMYAVGDAMVAAGDAMASVGDAILEGSTAHAEIADCVQFGPSASRTWFARTSMTYDPSRVRAASAHLTQRSITGIDPLCAMATCPADWPSDRPPAIAPAYIAMPAFDDDGHAFVVCGFTTASGEYHYDRVEFIVTE